LTTASILSLNSQVKTNQGSNFAKIIYNMKSKLLPSLTRRLMSLSAALSNACTRRLLIIFRENFPSLRALTLTPLKNSFIHRPWPFSHLVSLHLKNWT